MISETHAKKFCEEDISLIENYEQAINDKNNKWDCHHRLGEQYSRKYLIENGLYKKRPASELIFILEEEHRRFHNKGKHLSEKTKKKMSKSRMGNHNSPTKPILQYTKDWEFIREWVSASEASKVLGINNGDIVSCCKCKRKSAGGFVWKYSYSK